jgi:crotonobetainyl-CoA:carnitine CoA-transferase CaiB-like acyl-CoA transferase
VAAAALGAAGVPFGFVNDMAEVFAQPEAGRVFLRAPAPGDGGDIRGVRTFVAEGLARRGDPAPPPPYNAHGRSILEELGYDEPRMNALVSQGVWPGDR